VERLTEKTKMVWSHMDCALSSSITCRTPTSSADSIPANSCRCLFDSPGLSATAQAGASSGAWTTFHAR